MRLREFFIPSTDSSDEPLFHHYIDNNIAFVSNFVIPKHLRGKGLGRQIYQEWENSLPPSVKAIELRAKNETAKAFWGKLGFREKYPKLAIEDACPMIKLR